MKATAKTSKGFYSLIDGGGDGGGGGNGDDNEDEDGDDDGNDDDYILKVLVHLNDSHVYYIQLINLVFCFYPIRMIEDKELQ